MAISHDFLFQWKSYGEGRTVVFCDNCNKPMCLKFSEMVFDDAIRFDLGKIAVSLSLFGFCEVIMAKTIWLAFVNIRIGHCAFGSVK
jgi:hypothetical protein